MQTFLVKPHYLCLYWVLYSKRNSLTLNTFAIFFKRYNFQLNKAQKTKKDLRGHVIQLYENSQMKLWGAEKCQSHIAFLVVDKDYSPDFASWSHSVSHAQNYTMLISWLSRCWSWYLCFSYSLLALIHSNKNQSFNYIIKTIFRERKFHYQLFSIPIYYSQRLLQLLCYGIRGKSSNELYWKEEDEEKDIIDNS